MSISDVVLRMFTKETKNEFVVFDVHSMLRIMGSLLILLENAAAIGNKHIH